MKTVGVHEAKTHLSRLIAEAEAGEPFVIARGGKPVVKVTAMDAAVPVKRSRLGMLEGQAFVPHDFDTLCEPEIEAMFYGEDDGWDTSSTPTS